MFFFFSEIDEQWLQGLEIFDLVIADAEMGQLRAFLESSETAADPVVAQLQPLQFRQLGETLQTGKKQTVAQTQNLKARKLLTFSKRKICPIGFILHYDISMPELLF